MSQSKSHKLVKCISPSPQNNTSSSPLSSPYRIFETHAHLDFKDYAGDRDHVLAYSFQAGVEKIINVGINLQTTADGLRLSEKYPQIKVSGGFHPCHADSYDEPQLRQLLNHHNILAVGEVGLDYYRMYTPKEIQLNTFAAQILLAKELNLPLIVHCREADQDCYQLLKKYAHPQVVFHCFTGNVHFAEKIFNEGWYISITGVVTYPNNNLAEVLRILPRDKFFIETDSPYLTPVPMRGKRNSPAYLIYIIQKIADILLVPPKVIAQQSFTNAEQFFRWN